MKWRDLISEDIVIRMQQRGLQTQFSCELVKVQTRETGESFCLELCCPGKVDLPAVAEFHKYDILPKNSTYFWTVGGFVFAPAISIWEIG